MGYFGVRCMITGVSLNFCSPRCIKLSWNESNHSYMPLTLPVSGEYNYLGGVEAYGEEQNYLITLFYPDINIRHESTEDIYQLIRSILNGPNALILNGVWDAIARNYPSYWYSDIDNIKRIFHPHAQGLILNSRPNYPFEEFLEEKLWECEEEGIEPPTKDEIKKEYLIYCMQQYNTSEMATIDTFLCDQQMCWHPSEIINQHPEPVIRQYLKEAKENFSDFPTIIEVLLRYEHDMESYFKEHEEIQREIREEEICRKN